MPRTATVFKVNCVICQVEIEYRGTRVKRTCSPACRAKQNSLTMAKTNRVHASARMIARNPMKREDVRARVSASLKEIGHKPSVQGGNGHGPTEAQRLLAERLGWTIEYVVPTKQKRDSGFPTHYKLDIADEALKIGVEIDGNSHCALVRRAQDAKKEAFLASIGWKVIRFSNVEVMNDVEACISVVRSA